MKKKIALCGGGNLTHALIGIFSSSKDISLSLLTRNPNKWNHQIKVNAPDGSIYEGHLDKISSDPSIGLKFICDLAKEHNIHTPNLDTVLTWGLSIKD